MRHAIAMLLLLLLSAAPRAEDFQCMCDAGCTARITVDGEVTTEEFRKGDIVSSDSGYVVEWGQGTCWDKVKTDTSPWMHSLDGAQHRLPLMDTLALTWDGPRARSRLLVVRMPDRTVYVYQEESIRVPPDISLIGLY